MVISWEQKHPEEEEDFFTCALDDDCWEPLQLGAFAIPHLYLGVFSVCTMLVFLKELLTGPDHPHIKGYRLTFFGLLSTLLFTLFNLYLFIVLSMNNDFEIDWKVAVNRRGLAYILWGYGAVTSYLFIVGCLVKYLGILVCHLNIYKSYSRIHL